MIPAIASIPPVSEVWKAPKVAFLCILTKSTTSLSAHPQKTTIQIHTLQWATHTRSVIGVILERGDGL